MPDASQPLKNARHERFALALAVDKSAHAAYQLAGYKPDTGHAVRLAANGSIQARVKSLKLQAAKAVVLTIEEKREFLRNVVLTPVGEVDENSILCQSVKDTENGREFKMPCKLKAIALDNDLAGEGSEAGANGALKTFAERLALIRSHKKQ